MVILSVVLGVFLGVELLNVLTLYRGTVVVPNPRASREIEAGDRLLCFGKLDAMRDLIPDRTRRLRRPKVAKLPPPEDAENDA